MKIVNNIKNKINNNNNQDISKINNSKNYIISNKNSDNIVNQENHQFYHQLIKNLNYQQANHHNVKVQN